MIIIDTVYQRGYQHNLNAGFVQVVNRPQLYIEQISNLAVTIRIVTNSIELEIYITQASLGCLPTEFLALCELNSVSCSLHGVVTNFTCVTNSFDEVWRNRRLSPRQLHGHLAPRFDGDRVIKNLLDLVHSQFVHKTDLVRVHEAGIAHHVAAVRKIDSKHSPSAIPDRAGSMIVKGLVVVRCDIAAGKRCLYVLQEFRIDSH